MLQDEVSRLQALLRQREQSIASHQQQLVQRDQVIAALTRERDEYQLEKLRLQLRLAQLLKQAYGPRADRLRDPGQLLLEFAQQLEQQPLAVQEATVSAAPVQDAAGESRGAARRLRTRGRRDIGAMNHLPIIEQTYELTGDECLCPTCRQQREKIGQEISYTIEHVPAAFVRIRHIQCTYACRACEQNGHNPQIERAGKSGGSPIDKGMVGPGLLAYIATSKYADYLPLHRLQAIFGREGFELDRSTMCLWMADVARIVRPVYDRMVQRVLQSHMLATDDTVMPLLEPGKARQARMWIYQGDDDHPYNVFDFTISRSRDGPQAFLKNFRGTLLADAYGGYDGIVLDQDLPRAGCWSHARRKFVNVESIARPEAQAILAPINRLFAIEKHAALLNAGERLHVRQSESQPLIASLQAMLQEHKEKLLPKHPLAQAIGYVLNQWQELTLFLTDGAVPIHNNLAEQQMKRIALLRKNALFVGSPRGGETAAVISSLTSTCRRHEINPQVYLTQLLANLPGTPMSRLDEWLPDQWKQHNASTTPTASAPQNPAN